MVFCERLGGEGSPPALFLFGYALHHHRLLGLSWVRTSPVLFLRPADGRALTASGSRYAFGRPTSWAFDASYILYGALFIMAGAYALSRNGHVRGDFLYRNFAPRTQAWFPSRTGSPVASSDQPPSAKRSMPRVAKRADTSTCAAARKLMTTVSASASAGHDDDVESIEKVSTGGSADTEITEVAVNP